MRQLPSLNGLRAFEAAARQGGFTGAAAELNVTPAAISRLVRLLEERLGLALFERHANGLTLTAAGRTYQAGLTPAFDGIAHLTEQITAVNRARTLTVGVGPTFAIRWLISRLAEFSARAPEIELRIATGGAAVPFGDDWACGVKLGVGDWPGLIAEPLFAADLLPVCAPSLAAQLVAPDQLATAPLIRVAHASSDWPDWLARHGDPLVIAAGPVFEFYGQALQAALDGVGVAMGIRPYIDDDLAAGRLVAPFVGSISRGMGWYLVYRADRGDEEDFKKFREWITESAARPHEVLR